MPRRTVRRSRDKHSTADVDVAKYSLLSTTLMQMCVTTSSITMGVAVSRWMTRFFI